jgi:hypothetical protein
VKCRMVAESSRNMGSVMPVMVLHIMGEESEVWDRTNNNKCNNSDEDFRIFCDLLKFYNALPFCLVFVTSIFRCKWNIFFLNFTFRNVGASYSSEHLVYCVF